MAERAVIRVGPESSTLRDRWLGARLREKRAAAGLTAEWRAFVGGVKRGEFDLT